MSMVEVPSRTNPSAGLASAFPTATATVAAPWARSEEAFRAGETFAPSRREGAKVSPPHVNWCLRYSADQAIRSAGT